jgi:hypothetical protein
MGISEIIRRAIEIGERNGKVTFDDLNALCDAREIQPEDIERVLNALDQAGISVEDQ